jgi:hypothetical protein
MNRNTCHLGRIAALLCLGPTALVAQSVLTGTIVVAVKTPTGSPLAGVRVEIKGDKLIGTRAGLTDDRGYFRIPVLPPGSYQGTLLKDGFKPRGIVATVAMGGTATVEATLEALQSAGAVVEVSAGNTSRMEKTDVSAKENFVQEDILKLPVGRTLAGITALAPGVTAGTAGRAAMSGSATYENKYLVNGADTNDNLFNSDVNLFIEDAIDETQVMSNNVSAEYGRFTGGVINALTKRGGNDFEGSMRVVATNNGWNAMLPYQNRDAVVSKLNTIYSLTFGGPVLKDRWWFFAAGRFTKTDTALELPETGWDYTQKFDEKRYELNTTLQLTNDHRFGASYLRREPTTTERRPLTNNTADLAGLQNRGDIMSLTTFTYDGVLSSNLNVNVMFTKKLQKVISTSPGNFGNNGGSAFWQSPVANLDGVGYYNNHYFGNDPEWRDNNSLKATITHFLQAAGTHELKAGYERFEEINEGTNSQSPTGYVIDASYVNYASGVYAPPTYDFDANSYLEDWTKSPGGKFTSTYDALFVNDNWSINNHWNLSAGLRYDRFKGKATGGYQHDGFKEIQPRVGLNYDPRGDGVWQYNMTYATYAGKANQTIISLSTYVGNPAVSYYWYAGPDASGITPGASAAGFRRSDYDAAPFYISDPARNTLVDPNIKAPLTYEWTWGMKHKVSSSTNFTLSYINRKMTRMFEDYVGMHGTVDVDGFPFSYVYWTNGGDDVQRLYRAIVGTWETRSDLYGGQLSVRGNITLSRLTGNYEGDGGNAPGGGTAIGNFPLTRPGAVASGVLPNDEPIAIKSQLLWNRPIGRNSLAVGMNLGFNSGKPYSLTNLRDDLDDGTYVDSAGSYTRYYGPRGTGRFRDTWNLDLSLQWDGKLGSGPKPKLGYFVKLTAINVLNAIQNYSWETRGANWGPWTPRTTASSPYGSAWLSNNYVGNRTMQLECGFRF